MSCTSGKLGWPRKQAAKRFLRRSRGLHRTRLMPYRCDECGYWHLGHRTVGYYQRQP